MRVTSSIFLLLSVLCLQAQDKVTISGHVTDFMGNTIDSCQILLMRNSFSPTYQTYTDSNGYYKLDGVDKGHYMGMYALRTKEYPKEDLVPDDEKRLEFWAWNIIADRDLPINPRYHRLELYGTTVFQEFGGYPGLFVYFRPMSTSKYLAYSRKLLYNKEMTEKEADISVLPEYLEVKIFADEEPLKINLVQRIREFAGESNNPMNGYLVQVDVPKTTPNKPYIIFRVEAENKEYNEKGENLYFYELPKFFQNEIK